MAFLREGEKIIVKDDAKSDYFGKGTLYMTNIRIVLEVMTGGLMSKTPEIKIDQPMSSIKEVSVPARKTLQIQFEGSVEPHVALCGRSREMGSRDPECINHDR